MMMINSSRNRKLAIGLMSAMIGIRLLIFALGTVGVITWGPSLNASMVSWIVPVAMPMVIISLMLLTGRRGMMGRMTRAAYDTPLLEITQRRLALGEITKKQYEEVIRVLLDKEHSYS